MDLAKIQKARDDGFNSGLNWPDAWENHPGPGGPWVPSRGHSPSSIMTHEQLAAERSAWLLGFEEGHAQKLVTRRVNPLLGTDLNRLHHENIL